MRHKLATFVLTQVFSKRSTIFFLWRFFLNVYLWQRPRPNLKQRHKNTLAKMCIVRGNKIWTITCLHFLLNKLRLLQTKYNIKTYNFLRQNWTISLSVRIARNPVQFGVIKYRMLKIVRNVLAWNENNISKLKKCQ